MKRQPQPKRRDNNSGCIVERKDQKGFKGYAPDPAAKSGRKWFASATFEGVEDKIDRFLNPQPEAAAVPTWDEAALEDLAILKSKGRSPDTIRLYESFRRVHFFPVVGNLPVNAVTPRHAETIMANAGKSRRNWREDLGQRNSPATRNRVREYGRALYSRLRRRYPELALGPNPFEAVDPVTADQEEPKLILSGKDRDRVIKAAPSAEYRAIFAIGLLLGTRQAMILGLSEDRIDFIGGVLVFDRQLKRVDGAYQFRKIKGKLGRVTVPLDEPLTSYLREALAARKLVPIAPSKERFCKPSESSLVFPGEDGHGMNATVVTKTFQATLEGLGLPSIPFHRTRTTFVSLAKQGGVDGEVVSSIVGHSDQRTTEKHYTVIPLERQRKALRKVGNSLGNSPRAKRQAKRAE